MSSSIIFEYIVFLFDESLSVSSSELFHFGFFRFRDRRKSANILLFSSCKLHLCMVLRDDLRTFDARLRFGSSSELFTNSSFLSAYLHIDDYFISSEVLMNKLIRRLACW